jgi:PAS domain S-box-containing protein
MSSDKDQNGLASRLFPFLGTGEARQGKKRPPAERALLQTLMDNNPDAICSKDTDGRIVWVNGPQAELLGIDDPQDAIGKTDFDFFSSEIAQEAHDAERDVIKSKQPLSGKMERVERPDGQTVWLSVTRAPLTNDVGRVTGIVGISRDVTELKQAEEALQQSEDRFQQITSATEAIEDVLYSVDGTTEEFTYLSPAFERLLGYTEHDIQRMGGRKAFLSEVIEGEDFSDQADVFQELLSESDTEIPVWRAWWRCKDGSRVHLEDHSVPVYDGKRLVSTTGVLRDTTDRQQAQEELHQLAEAERTARERLEAMVQHATATVSEIQATVTQTAERAGSVAEMARHSVDVSQQGQQAVANSIEGMQLIRQRVESIADNILALSENTQKIGEIIASVNDVAEQSKLLALNASIEASRAGEEGRGFSVVAQEMRNLAEQSREATVHVRAILNEIQQATNSAVMATEEGAKGVDLGQSLIDQAGQTIQDLAAVIQDAAQAASEIAASTRQQSSGVEQLSAVMEDLWEKGAENPVE